MYQQDQEMMRESALLSYQQQLDLFYAYKNNGDIEAFQRLLSCHIRLAYKVADSYNCLKLQDDLRSEALLALHFAIERWDPRRGALTTIATPIIRQRLTRFLIENSHVARVPYLAYRNCSKEGFKADHVFPIINARYLSNRSSSEDEHLILESRVVEELSDNELLDSIRNFMDSTDEEHKTLIELIYGIGDHYDDKMSLGLLSRMLRVSKSRLKTQINRVREYIANPHLCKLCGKAFLRKNRRKIYCDSCQELCESGSADEGSEKGFLR